MHNLHNGSCGHPLLSKLSAVSILRWRRIHAKILHFGSAFAFQIGVIDIFFKMAHELNAVSAACGVFPICCPSPNNDLVISTFISWQQSNFLPKSYKLMYLLTSREGQTVADLEMVEGGLISSSSLFLSSSSPSSSSFLLKNLRGGSRGAPWFFGV